MNLRRRIQCRLFTGLMLALALIFLATCQFKGESNGELVEISTDRQWQPKPVSMRIYPSTRYVMESDKPLLEARIELFDEMGDSIKSAGQVRAELFAVSEAASRSIGHRLYLWNINIHSLEDQQTYYDPITRGYIFRLRLDQFNVAVKATLLRVTFFLDDNTRLQTEDVVRTNW